MSPTAQSDGHDAPRLIDEAVPGEAAVIEDVGVDSQLSRMNCQMFSTGSSSGHFDGSGNRAMLAGMMSAPEPCPPRPIEQEYGVCARRDSGGDFRQMQGHALRVASWQHERCPFAFGRADRLVDI